MPRNNCRAAAQPCSQASDCPLPLLFRDGLSPIQTGFLTKQKPSPTRIREGEKTVRNLSFCRINNKESHPRHTRQPNNTKHESAAQPLARKADLTCTAAECEIKCDRQF